MGTPPIPPLSSDGGGYAAARPFGPALAAGSLLAPLLWPVLAPVFLGR